jgi:hypothetical protein
VQARSFVALTLILAVFSPLACGEEDDGGDSGSGEPAPAEEPDEPASKPTPDLVP